MLKFVVLVALIASASASALKPRAEDSSQVQQKLDNFGIQNPELPPSQHYYPTYPTYNSPNYGVQANYDSSLAPVTPPRQAVPTWSSTIASGLVPLGSFALTYGARAVLLVFQFVVLSLIGIVLTTSICTFTPFCKITFDGFALTKYQVREQVSELARAYMTPDNLNMAAMLVRTAVETYSEMQKQMEREKMAGTTERNRGDIPERRRRRRR